MITYLTTMDNQFNGFSLLQQMLYQPVKSYELSLLTSGTFFFLQKTSLEMLLFLSDNLAHFPYATLEEPLFVAHHIDMTLSVTGSTLLQSFNEVSFLLLFNCVNL